MEDAAGSGSRGADFLSDSGLVAENAAASDAVETESNQEGPMPGNANTEEALIVKDANMSQKEEEQGNADAKAGAAVEATANKKEDMEEIAEERKEDNHGKDQTEETENGSSLNLMKEQDHVAEGGKGVQQERPEIHPDTAAGVQIDEATSAGKGRGRGRIQKSATDSVTSPKASVKASKQSTSSLPSQLASRQAKYNLDLMDAARYCDMNQMEWLLKRGTDINTRHPSTGHTPLMLAVENGHNRAVTFLIRKGADINERSSRDDNSESALFKAVRFKRTRMVLLLLLARADRNLRATVQNMDFATTKVMVDRGATISSRNDQGVTALQMAAANGSVAILRLLYEEGFGDIDARDYSGRTALMRAADGNHGECIETLVKRDARINIACDCGITPLMRAAKSGGTEAVKLLLARKADITARDEDDNTAIHHACTARGPASQCLRSAHTCTAAKTRNAHLGNTDILRMLLEAGAAFNLRNELGDLPFHTAARSQPNKTAEFIAELFAAANKQFPTDPAISSTNYDGASALILCLDVLLSLHKKRKPDQKAIENARSSIFKLLFFHVDVNLADNISRTPVMLAARIPGQNDTQLLKAILAHGANVLATNEAGETPRALALQFCPKSEVPSLLAAVELEQMQKTVGEKAAAGNSKAIERLLTSTGPDSRPQPGAFANAVCDRNRLTTALMRAARHNQAETVRMLLKNKADVDMRDMKGFTALMWACASGSTDTVQVLLEDGEANVNIKSVNGYSALMLAAMRNHIEALNCLLCIVEWNPWIDMGGDLDQETRQGDTALMLATAACNTEAVKLLLHHGADIRIRRRFSNVQIKLKVGDKSIKADIDIPEAEMATAHVEEMEVDATEDSESKAMRLQHAALLEQNEDAVREMSEINRRTAAVQRRHDGIPSPKMTMRKKEEKNQSDEETVDDSAEMPNASEPKAATKTKDKSKQRVGVTVMSIAAALNDGGEILELIKAEATKRALREEIEALKRNREKAEALRAIKEEHEALLKQEMERQEAIKKRKEEERKAREAMREKMRLEAEAKKEQARVEAEEREQRLAAARAKRQEEEPDVDSSDEELSDY